MCFVLFLAAITCAEHLPVTIYTSADGLGSSFVDSLMRDSRGFMWFCTRDGLSRFDGARFVTYQLGVKDAPPGFENLFETRDGKYFVTTTGGTFRFDSNQLSQPDAVSPRINAEFITGSRGSFFEDSRGNVWFSSGGIFRLTEKDGKPEFEKYEVAVPAGVNPDSASGEISETADGSLWINSTLYIIRLLPDKRTIFYSFEPALNGGNTFLSVDKSNNVWIMRNNHVFVMKPETPEQLAGSEKAITKPVNLMATFELQPEKPFQLPENAGKIIQFTGPKNNSFIEKSYSKKVFQSSDGNTWITSDNSLLQFSNGIFHLHNDKEGLPPVMARMAEDTAGNLWIGSYTGLARVNRNGFVTFGTNDGANSSRFFALNQAADGTLYFAAHDFYINQFDGVTLKPVRPNIPLESNFLWTSRYAFVDSANNWWFLTGDKLYRFDNVANVEKLKGMLPTKVYSKTDGLKSDRIFQIFESSKGDIWVSTRDDGGEDGSNTSRLKKGEDKFYTFSETDGLPPQKSFSSAVEDFYGNIWFGFYSGGLARFNGEKFDYFGEKSGLPPNVLPDLHIDKKGHLWIASAVSGIYRLDDVTAKTPEFVHITTADGLNSNNIRTITEDRSGRIYLGTVRGVDLISPGGGKVKHYSVNDGLAADFVVDSLCDKDGNLWFATNDGVSRLIPEPEETISPPQIFLDNLRIAGEQQSIPQLGTTLIDEGDLSSNQNNLQIDFFGLDFRAGETLRYQYKLEGADADWSQPSEQRTSTFANLSPGTYRFLVRAVNSEGVVSENPAVINFKILPPIWQRWWFITLCVLLVIGFVIALERYRAARLRELQTAFGEITVSEERFRQLVEQSPVGIMILETDGKIRSANQAYMDVWGKGVTFEQIKNWDLSADKQLAAQGVPEGLRQAFAGNTFVARPLRYELRRNDAGVAVPDDAPQFVYMQAIAYPVKNEAGDVREVICFLEDVTARKTAEEKLQKSREERLAELEKVRSRIATDLHDDIGSSLTQIAILSEVAQTKNSGKGANESLTRISDVSNELVEAMSDIVWSINPKKDRLSALTQRMRRFASDVLRAKGIAFQFHTPDANNKIVVNANLRRETFLIFKELVNNIVKHSDAKTVEISLSVSDGKLILEIEDDGKGFDIAGFDPRQSTDSYFAKLNPETMGGNGIRNISRRAGEMYGEIIIDSQIGAGTRIFLRLPLEATAQTGSEESRIM